MSCAGSEGRAPVTAPVARPAPRAYRHGTTPGAAPMPPNPPPAASRYDIHTDVKFAALERIDISALAAAAVPWFNQTLTRVNDCVVRLGVIHGDFHWHKHDHEDEFFYVLAGRLLIDLED